MFSQQWGKSEESKSCEVKMKDFHANAVESMVYFLYHNEVSNENMSNSACDLLLLAHKYNIADLTAFCLEYLKGNLLVDLVSAYLHMHNT